MNTMPGWPMNLMPGRPYESDAARYAAGYAADMLLNMPLTPFPRSKEQARDQFTQLAEEMMSTWLRMPTETLLISVKTILKSY